MICENHKRKLFALAEGESIEKMRKESFVKHSSGCHAEMNSNFVSANDGNVSSMELDVGSTIDFLTPQWASLSNNNDESNNKESHSLTSPPTHSSSTRSSCSVPCCPIPSTTTTFTSCSSSDNPTAKRGVNGKLEPPKSDNVVKGQQQHSTPSPPQSQTLVLTHDHQRKMKRRRSNYVNNRIINRDRILSSLRGRGSRNGSLLFGLMFIIASLIHSSHEQFISPSSDEWDGGSFRSGTYGNGYTCVNIPVNFTLCKNIGYSKMMIPNLLGHDSLQEAEFHAKSWVPLLGLQCHPDTQLFLCSLFSPICLDRPIYPCRSLCQGVQAKCEPRMLAYNYPWPSMLKCDQFPEDHDLCIRPGAANKSDGEPELECPSCNQAHTCENIVDNFCRADFVFRAKYRKSRGALVEFRKERSFKPREGNRRGRELRTLSLDSKDDCCANKLIQGFPYIVMGIKRGDDYIITFAMHWNPKDKILKHAVRTFRTISCQNPIPMSVTAADGKAGASRNGTNGAGRRRRRKQGKRRDRQYGGCRVSAPGRNNNN